jgi:uncharacterized membrane protein
MASEEDQAVSPALARHLSPDRVLAFTDGTVAIIITILVLDIRVPDLAAGASLADAMTEVWPTLVSWVVSFLLVGMYWLWHRGVFADVRFVDLNLAWLNLIFLLFLALVPFGASTLGEHSEEPVALHIYGLILIAVTLARFLINTYLNRHPDLLYDPKNRRSKQTSSVAAAMPLVIYIVAMIVADWAPELSLLLFFAVPALYFGFVAFLKSDPKTSADSQSIS